LRRRVSQAPAELGGVGDVELLVGLPTDREIALDLQVTHGEDGPAVRPRVDLHLPLRSGRSVDPRGGRRADAPRAVSVAVHVRGGMVVVLDAQPPGAVGSSGDCRPVRRARGPQVPGPVAVAGHSGSGNLLSTYPPEAA